jgi:hypothetical protein
LNRRFWILRKSKFFIFNGMLIISFLLAACGAGGVLPGSRSSEPPVYMAALNKALDVCDHVEVDQVCFGQGTITVEPQPNARLESFTQPGDTLALAGITGLRLESGTSIEDWGVAVMRWQADFTDTEKYLTIVVMGETQLSDIHSSLEELPPLAFSSGEQAADNPFILEPLQGFNFSSAPLSDEPADPPNGLLMWTPLSDDTASILINGAVVTLGSTAMVQAQPGGQMTVAMFEGDALVTAADGQSGIAEGGTQVSVPVEAPSPQIRDPRAEALAHAIAQYNPEPLDPRAAAIAEAVAQYASAPLDPRAEAISRAVAQYVGSSAPADPRAEALSWAVSQYPHAVAKDIKTRYQRAIERCTDLETPQPRYIYNILYFYNLTRSFTDPDILEAIRQAKISDLDAEAGRCLSFELDFDSTVFTENVLQSTSHVRAAGVKFQFSPSGEVTGESSPLQYLSFETKNITEGACEVGSYETVNGTFQVTGGALKVNKDQLTLTLEIEPKGATENLVFACPNAEVPTPNFLHWRTYFATLHGSQQLEIDRFAIQDWKFTGQDGHFAEAIYETNLAVAGAQMSETTFIVLVHTPQP